MAETVKSDTVYRVTAMDLGLMLAHAAETGIAVGKVGTDVPNTAAGIALSVMVEAIRQNTLTQQ